MALARGRVEALVAGLGGGGLHSQPLGSAGEGMPVEVDVLPHGTASHGTGLATKTQIVAIGF
jgi:hypothetical protein